MRSPWVRQLPSDSSLTLIPDRPKTTKLHLVLDAGVTVIS